MFRPPPDNGTLPDLPPLETDKNLVQLLALFPHQSVESSIFYPSHFCSLQCIPPPYLLASAPRRHPTAAHSAPHPSPSPCATGPMTPTPSSMLEHPNAAIAASAALTRRTAHSAEQVCVFFHLFIAFLVSHHHFPIILSLQCIHEMFTSLRHIAVQPSIDVATHGPLCCLSNMSLASPILYYHTHTPPPVH